jgi:hypothetical protein
LSPDLATALRSETPTAPSTLRERVALVAATSPRPRRRFPLRRVLVFAAPVTLAASFAVALAVGIESATTNRIGEDDAGSAGGNVLQLVPLERQMRSQSADKSTELFKAQPQTRADAAPGAPVTPSQTRAQNVQATLTVLVDDTADLSATTQRALRATRRLGGYVVTVRYGTPEPTEGTATLRLRIPVSRVQAAIVQFSGLGRILAQETQITDLQQSLDDLTRQIRRLERTGGSKEQIAALRRQRTEINRRAAFATVSLDLTTHEPRQKATPPSRFDRAVDDATGVLAAELAIGAYALIVAAPILLLLGLAFAGSRAYRRYSDQRLLERA